MNIQTIFCIFLQLFCWQLSAQVVDSCTIFNVFAEAHDCDENGDFLVDIEFDAFDTGETFEIRGNGRSYGIFEYGQTFYTIGPISGDETRDLEFIIIDQQEDSCMNFTALRHSGCGNNGSDTTMCEIRDLFIDSLICQQNGQYSTTIDFIYENAGNDFFDLFINGVFADFYRLNELPLRLEDLDLNNSDSLFTVSVCINDNRNCCAEQTVFNYTNCGNNNGEDSTTCRISNVFAEAHDCDENGDFLVDIEFDAENTGEIFEIRGNGRSYGVFEYGQNFYTVGPITGDEARELEFVIIDQQNEGCQNFTALRHPGCEDGGGNVDSCFITDFSIGSIFRDSTGRVFTELNIKLDSAYLAGSSDVFYETVGCNGFLSTASTIIVEYFEPCCYETFVTNNEGDSCSQQLCIEFPDVNTCEVRDLVIDSLTCQENGQYFMTIDFIHENANNDFFDLFINGEFQHFYRLSDLPIRLRNIEVQDSSVLTVSVCINDNRDCCVEETVFDFVDCDNGGGDSTTCGLNSLSYSNIECQDNDIFAVTIDVDFDSISNELVEVFYDTIFISNYRIDDFPIRLDSLDINVGNDFWSFTVCSPNIPNCCVSNGFSVTADQPFCFGNFVWPGDVNLDNIVDVRDLLGIGAAFNITGPSRENASLDWEAQYVDYWLNLEPFRFAPHRGHADTNGDGIVNELDLEALFVNYGKTHGLIEPLDSIIAAPNDPALQFNLPPDGSVNNGQFLSVPITLGTADNPIDDIYGLSFTLQFNPQVINPETVEIEYPTTWFGEPNVNVLTIDKTFADRGIIQVAITRNDQNNVSGFGEIARFVGMIDDIIGYGRVEVEVTEIQASKLNGSTIPLNTYKLDRHITNVSSIQQDLNLMIYPNPMTNYFNIVAPTLELKQVRIYTMTGQLLQIAEHPNRIAAHDWNKGIYLIEIQTEQGTAFRKIIKK